MERQPLGPRGDLNRRLFERPPLGKTPASRLEPWTFRAAVAFRAAAAWTKTPAGGLLTSMNERARSSPSSLLILKNSKQNCQRQGTPSICPGIVPQKKALRAQGDGILVSFPLRPRRRASRRASIGMGTQGTRANHGASCSWKLEAQAQAQAL